MTNLTLMTAQFGLDSKKMTAQLFWAG